MGVEPFDLSELFVIAFCDSESGEGRRGDDLIGFAVGALRLDVEGEDVTEEPVREDDFFTSPLNDARNPLFAGAPALFKSEKLRLLGRIPGLFGKKLGLGIGAFTSAAPVAAPTGPPFATTTPPPIPAPTFEPSPDALAPLSFKLTLPKLGLF